MKHQRGISTLLIILTIAIGATVATVATAYALRGLQQRQLTTHASTAAQGAAWRGVETLRLALVDAGQAQLASWHGGDTIDCGSGGRPLDLAVSGMTALGIADARLTAICRLPGDGYRVTARVTGVAGEQDSRATSTVEVVYAASSEGLSDTTPEEPASSGDAAISVVQFNDDLALSGSLSVRAPEGTKTRINVQGDLTTGGNSITGVDTIWTSGSIRISSGSSFGTLRANGDIKFDGSVSARELVEARGDICVSGGASAANATIRANGSVSGDGGVSLGDVAAIGSSDRGDRTPFCGALDRDIDGRPYAVDLKGNAGARSVAASGSVRIGSGSITRQPDGLRASGHLVDTNWGGSEYGQVGGTVTGDNPAIRDWVRSVPGLSVALSPVSPVVLSTSTFNAYEVEHRAHYAFKVDSAGYRVVTVRDIANVANGTYFIADYDNTQETGWNRGYKDFLCTTLAAGSTPQAPRCSPPLSDSPGTLCQGYSTYNSCLSYNASTRLWSLNGTTFAPGVLWFEGDVTLGNGNYTNTVVATGNIDTGGALTLSALAYAGYAGVCSNTAFPKLYPLDYCDRASGTFTHPTDSTIGNYAMLAGSVDASGRYRGGNITLGASNTINGSLLAGNSYGSGGSTTVRGSVSALSQGASTHAAAGSTTIELVGLPSTFDPAPPHCGLTGTCVEDPTPGSPGTWHTRVLWTRYR